MKPARETSPRAADNGDTGLPWPRTWPGVYTLVLAGFLLWVLLLLGLGWVFQ